MSTGLKLLMKFSAFSYQLSADSLFYMPSLSILTSLALAYIIYIKSIRPNGIIVYNTYIVALAQFGKPGYPDHLLEYNDSIFLDFRRLRNHVRIMIQGQQQE